ncbi:MAG: UDP-N-acetylmuramoyl-L-alanyl-D-glutamate--2,6-diaminopimelate ligase [Planctomycetota bacterium]
MTELAYPSGLPTGRGYVRLRELRDCLRPKEVLRFRDLAIDGLQFHSAEVRPGNLFFAIRGTRNDGTRFVQEALGRGACAVVSEEPLPLPCPVLVVKNVRAALADAARFYYRDPSRAVSVVGITGTNGKTTVAHLLRSCLQADHRKVGMLGTIAYEFGGRRIMASNTTPDPVRIHGYLREMADDFTSVCVMEVSSHSLDQDRVRGVRFASGIFTNLTQDHLDYHRDMASYAAAKARLFEQLAPGTTAILNRDDPASIRMAERLAPGVRLLWFGLDPSADVRAEHVDLGPDGTRFRLVMPHGSVELFLQLIGLHNVQNALAAAAGALALGTSELTLASALEDARPVAGRLERVSSPLAGAREDVRVFVDYAHTPDALEKVCSTLRDLGTGRLFVVFGCGGDRDPTKRAPMARAVARYADGAFLTSDNPRSEDPEAILSDVEGGIRGTNVDYWRIADRGEAIRAAIARAEAGDTVLIAGKGHETYQLLKDSVLPFDDRHEAARALAARGGGWLRR